MGFGQTANWPSLTPYVDIFSGPFLEVIARKTSILQHRGLKKMPTIVAKFQAIIFCYN